MIFQTDQISLAAQLIINGEIVAFPTETVYGLGASIFQPDAIIKIFLAKGRRHDNPLIAHISNFEQLKQIASEPPSQFFQLAKYFFPGPLTIILSKKESVPNIASANLPTIGIRMPAHPVAKALIDAVGHPLVAPSANLSGKPSSTTALHVMQDFGDKIGGVIDGGASFLGIESTVIVLNPQPTILRPGSITKEALESVLKEPFFYANENCERPLCPGTKYRHYAPNAKVKLFYEKSTFEKYQNSRKKQFILNNLEPKNLYSLFRQADAENYEEIVIHCHDAIQKNQALMNRLLKASSFDEW